MVAPLNEAHNDLWALISCALTLWEKNASWQVNLLHSTNQEEIVVLDTAQTSASVETNKEDEDLVSLVF